MLCSQPSQRRGKTLPVTIFVVSQVLIVSAAAAAFAWRYQARPDKFVVPPLRETPLVIAPVYDYEWVVSDDELSRVLSRLQPRLQGPKSKIGNIDHALRFWGTNTKFTDKIHPSGETLRRILLNHQTFTKLYGEAGVAKPLLINMPHGVRVRTQDGDLSSSHFDHTVASIAEVGTPLDYDVETPAGPAKFRNLVEQSFRDFSLNQFEYEWSTMIFAMYLPPQTSFISKEGQEISFDRLARRIMRSEQPQGVCFGAHRLYALVYLLRVHDESPLLSEEVRSEVVAYLRDMTQRLEATQHPDGFWNGAWPTQKPASSTPTDADNDRIGDRIIATGHALEWWAMVPPSLASELHPQRPTLVAASHWIIKTVDSRSDEQIAANFTYLSHAGRALALWRKKEAFEVPLSAVSPNKE